MSYNVYVLQSLKDNSFYIGSTQDLDDRLGRHNGLREKSTKSKAPWKIVYSEELSSRQEATKRERQIKSYKGGQAFKKLIRVSN